MTGSAGSRPPIRLVDVELSAPLPGIDPACSLSGDPYREARLLVRLHGRPLGQLDLAMPPEGLDAGLVADAIWFDLDRVIREHVRGDGVQMPEKLTDGGFEHPFPAPCSWRTARQGSTWPNASIVVTTCGESPARLVATVRAALAQTYPGFEVVVVDNRPATSAVPATLASAFPGQARLMYVAEPRKGLGNARNGGAVAASGDVIAFTDDDVDLDPDWLGWLIAGFDHPDVACVTGLILPMELETEAQRLLEEFGGYAKGFERTVWDGHDHRPANPLYPYTVGAFGSGANAAFRRDALTALGGFDPVLGAGTPARGGEDIDIYVTCVQRGWRIVYEPAAIVRHAHLRTMPEVHAKLRDYGVGLGAMLTKHLFRDAPSAAALARRLPAGVAHLLSARSPKNAARSSTYPRSLILAELRGLAYGPLAYGRSLRVQ